MHCETMHMREKEWNPMRNYVNGSKGEGANEHHPRNASPVSHLLCGTNGNQMSSKTYVDTAKHEGADKNITREASPVAHLLWHPPSAVGCAKLGTCRQAAIQTNGNARRNGRECRKRSAGKQRAHTDDFRRACNRALSRKTVNRHFDASIETKMMPS